MGTRARRRLLIAPAVFLAYLVLGVGPAGAQETTTTVAGASPPTTVATVAGPAVGGRLVDRDGEPVEGVELEVALGDELIDTATTDEDGAVAGRRARARHDVHGHARRRHAAGRRRLA